MHGKIDQKRRTKIYRQFRSYSLESKHLILLTTDLAARGIDIPDVDWIIQFDPPQSQDSYIHRIGRTARAGRTGSSLLLLNEPENTYIEFLKGKSVDLSEYSI